MSSIVGRLLFVGTVFGGLITLAVQEAKRRK